MKFIKKIIIFNLLLVFYVLSLSSARNLPREEERDPDEVDIYKNSNSLINRIGFHFALYDDSPSYYVECPQGMEADIHGKCREVWFEEYNW